MTSDSVVKMKNQSELLLLVHSIINYFLYITAKSLKFKVQTDENRRLCMQRVYELYSLIHLHLNYVREQNENNHDY